MKMEMSLKPLAQLVLSPSLQQSLFVLGLNELQVERLVQEAAQENPVIETEESFYDLLLKKGFLRDYPWASLEACAGLGPELAQAPASLFEHLCAEIDLMKAPREVLERARQIASLLDEEGRLSWPLVKLSKHLQCSRWQVTEALALVQQAEPAGLGARTLEESLALQLAPAGWTDPVGFRLVRHHLRDLALGRTQKIRRKMGLDERSQALWRKRLASLNPHPAAQLSLSKSTPALLPDLILTAQEGPEPARVELIRPGPGWHLHPKCREWLQSQTDPALRRKLKTQIQEAAALQKVILKRRSTLEQVAQAVFCHQREFAQGGLAALRPLDQKDIAEELGLHPSTVSRTVAGKAIWTAYGVLELARFFPGRAGASSNNLSVPAIQARIARLIEREDPHKPLSDQQITDSLIQAGISIKRRTTAKYREQAGWPSALWRRKRL